MLQKCCFPMGPFVAQGLAAMIANLTMFSAGFIFGWATSAMPILLRTSNTTSYDESISRITSQEGSWVVALASFGAIFGPILSNIVVDRIGRKWSLNMIVIPMLLSWLIIGLAKSVQVLYVGRFIGGLSLGAVYAVMPLYLGEIAEARIRGALGTMMTTIINIGMVTSFCIGPWVSLTTLAIISAIPPLTYLLLSPWMPESPYFLLMKGDKEKAMDSLVWLRQRSDVKEELSTMEAVVIEEQKNKSGFGIRQLFRTSANRRAFAISIGLLTFQQCSGLIVIQSYASVLFERSGLSGLSSVSVIIMGCVKLLSGFTVTCVIDLAGRRPILMLSAIFTAIFLTCEAVFFHMQYLGYETDSFSWLPLLAIIGFYFFFMPGLGSVPYVMIGELFPTDVKAPAAMLLAMYGSAMAVVVTQIYEVVNTAIGIHYFFYGFAAITLASAFVVFFYIPETKRLSLEDIQEFLKSGRSATSTNARDRHSSQTEVTKR